MLKKVFIKVGLFDRKVMLALADVMNGNAIDEQDLSDLTRFFLSMLGDAAEGRRLTAVEFKNACDKLVEASDGEVKQTLLDIVEFWGGYQWVVLPSGDMANVDLEELKKMLNF